MRSTRKTSSASATDSGRGGERTTRSTPCRRPFTPGKVNYIVDADIAKFFDSVSKEWLARSLEHRIGDKRVLRLIQKWLRAGVLEDGRIEVSERGTGQGAAISPLLANVYLLLRPRSVGRALATARSQGRHGHRTLRRRRDLRLRVGDRRPPLPGCDA